MINCYFLGRGIKRKPRIRGSTFLVVDCNSSSITYEVTSVYPASFKRPARSTFHLCESFSHWILRFFVDLGRKRGAVGDIELFLYVIRRSVKRRNSSEKHTSYARQNKADNVTRDPRIVY